MAKIYFKEILVLNIRARNLTYVTFTMTFFYFQHKPKDIKCKLLIDIASLLLPKTWWVSEWHSDKMTQCVTLARRVSLAQRQNDTVCHFDTVRHFGTEGHFNTATK